MQDVNVAQRNHIIDIDLPLKTNKNNSNTHGKLHISVRNSDVKIIKTKTVTLDSSKVRNRVYQRHTSDEWKGQYSKRRKKL